MRKRTLARIGFGLRMLAASTALLAAGVWCLYRYQPGLVDRFDMFLLQRFVQPATDELAAAAALVSTDPVAARAALEGIERRSRDCRPGDRAFAVWRQASVLLGDLARQQGDHARALELARAGVERDERDYPARLRLCELLLATPDLREEGRAHLRDLLELLGDEPPVVRRFATEFADQPAAVGKALADYLRRGRWPIWGLQYDGSDSLFPELDAAWVLPRFSPDGRVHATFWLPLGTRGLRLMLPADRWWGLAEPQLIAGEGDAAAAIALAQTVGGRRDGDVVWLDGQGCGLVYPLPLPTVGPTHLRFEARLQQLVEPWVRELLVGPRGDELLAALAATAEGRVDAAVLRRWRGAAGMQADSTLAFAGPTGGFADAPRVTVGALLLPEGEDGVPWSLSAAVPKGVTRVRLDPALLVGATLRIDAIDFADGAGARLSASSPADWTSLHDLQRVGERVLTGAGRDPFLVFPAPAGAATVTLRGVIR